MSGDTLFFLKGHGYDHHTVNRIGRPAIYLPKVVMTVFLAVQEDVLLNTAKNPAFGRGFFARFLYLLPAPRSGHYNTRTPDREVTARYERLIRALLDWQGERDEHGHRVPQTLRMSPDALALWLEFTNGIKDEQREQGKLFSPQWHEWLGKANEHLARLALSFRVVEAVDGGLQPGADLGPVTRANVECALRVMACLTAHAERAFALLEAGITTAVDDRAMAYIERNRDLLRQRRIDEGMGPIWAVKARDLHRAGIGFNTADAAKEALQRLEDAGHLQGAIWARPNTKPSLYFYFRPPVEG